MLQCGKDVADPKRPLGRVGVSIVKLNAADQRQRAAEVGQKPQREIAVCYGITGRSLLYQLPYVDANNVWLFAPSHTTLLGPLKDFWRHVLDPWTREGEICIKLKTNFLRKLSTLSHGPITDAGGLCLSPCPCYTDERGHRLERLLMAWLRRPPQVWCHQSASTPCWTDACACFTCSNLPCQTMAAMCPDVLDVQEAPQCGSCQRPASRW